MRGRIATVLVVALGVLALALWSYGAVTRHALSAAPTPVVPAALAAPPSPSPFPPPLPTPSHSGGRRVANDVRYCSDRAEDNPILTCLDIYAPLGAQGLPVIIYVHGGGWVSGDNEPIGAKGDYFARHGFVFMSINYRLAPEVNVGDQAFDVATAVAWIKEHAADYGGDGKRLFLLGHSAGAHLSALISTDEAYLRSVGLDLTAIRGVILLDGSAYDVEQLMRSAEGQAELFRQPFGANPEVWREISPRTHVAPGKGIPPHLLLLATPYGPRLKGAESLANALRACGVYAQIADASAFRDHSTIDSELGKTEDSPTEAVQAFLDMILAGPPPTLGGRVTLPIPVPS